MIKRKIKLTVVSLMVFIVVILISINLYKSSTTINVEVIGKSMEPTLHSGQTLKAQKDISKIKRGDIIIFRFPEKNKVLIKRVIGLPGEKIRIENEKVFINDKVLDEPYIKEQMNSSLDENLPVDFVIPVDAYYVMGDNRNNSNDSRSLGVIPIKSILGKLIR
ncbi:MAG: signal peptidase I [Clostridium tyrobutyricum]|jgi:signal peptidase I|uniref:signal peptidase I n=1 Tax=Clostridium tyrobutyricum TaxID=1519 RepID=UPI0011C70249|nr:signal peptidase I [Clostridium tyrobutyricum]MCH4236506.1 signal peptidase I [Clostridium tyrobutyricum]MCH4259474.1 signal peptidase I [Clostridium tyrobutyricum]